MRTRRLGRSSIEVSLVGVGCNQFGGRVDLGGTRAVVDAALELGVNFFDTADIYGGRGGSESLLGQALEGRRDEIVLATKFGMDMGDTEGLPDAPRGSRDYVRAAAEGSLRRLRTDVIDLYQYHQPDGVTPIEDTLEALGELVREGKVREIGCSNFDAGLLEGAEDAASERNLPGFVTLQNEYSLLKRDIEADVAPACERLDVGILPFFPLARGLLTGKYRRGEAAPEGSRLAGRDQVAADEVFDVVEALERYADERGISMLDVAISGLAAQPAVSSVIAGVTRPDQLEGNVRASEWVPSDEDLERLDQIAPTPRRTPARARA